MLYLSMDLTIAVLEAITSPRFGTLSHRLASNGYCLLLISNNYFTLYFEAFFTKQLTNNCYVAIHIQHKYQMIL